MVLRFSGTPDGSLIDFMRKHTSGIQTTSGCVLEDGDPTEME